jgi:ABC-type transport system substrate-binding protein
MEGQPYLDEVILKEVPDAAAARAALETGECDVLTDPDFKDVDAYKDDPEFEVMWRPDPASTLIVFDTTEPPFDDKRIRQAISKGIDRQQIVDVLFYGYAEPASDFFPSFHWAHDPDISVPYDPEGAKALLREAGYDESYPLKFTLLSRNEAVYLDQAALAQQQLEDIGVEMEVQPLEYTTLSGISRGPKEEWEALLYRITPLRGTAFEFTYYQYGEMGGLNRCWYNKEGGYQNPEFAALLDEAITYSDYDPAAREEAKPLYSELSKMWIEDAPGIILDWWADVDVLQPYVKGWNLAVSNKNLWQTVWLDN